MIEQPVNNVDCDQQSEDDARTLVSDRNKNQPGPNVVPSTEKSTPVTMRDVLHAFASRVTSLENRQTALDNLQALLHAKSTELQECKARLRDVEAARQAAERRWQLAVHQKIVNTSKDGSSSRSEGIASVKDGGCTESANRGNINFAPAQDQRGETDGEVSSMIREIRVASSTSPTANSNVENSRQFPTRIHPGVCRSCAGQYCHQRGLSNDLVQKLMQQNFRLKQTIRQLIENRHGMTVSEYLNWLEENDRRIQLQHTSPLPSKPESSVKECTASAGVHVGSVDNMQNSGSSCNATANSKSATEKCLHELHRRISMLETREAHQTSALRAASSSLDKDVGDGFSRRYSS